MEIVPYCQITDSLCQPISRKPEFDIDLGNCAQCLLAQEYIPRIARELTPSCLPLNIQSSPDKKEITVSSHNLFPYMVIKIYRGEIISPFRSSF